MGGRKTGAGDWDRAAVRRITAYQCDMGVRCRYWLNEWGAPVSADATAAIKAMTAPVWLPDQATYDAWRALNSADFGTDTDPVASLKSTPQVVTPVPSSVRPATRQ